MEVVPTIKVPRTVFIGKTGRWLWESEANLIREHIYPGGTLEEFLTAWLGHDYQVSTWKRVETLLKNGNTRYDK